MDAYGRAERESIIGSCFAHCQRDPAVCPVPILSSVDYRESVHVRPGKLMIEKEYLCIFVYAFTVCFTVSIIETSSLRHVD